jgi:TrfA protein
MSTAKPTINNLPLDGVLEKIGRSGSRSSPSKRVAKAKPSEVKKDGTAQQKIDGHLQILRMRQVRSIAEETIALEDRVLQSSFPFWDDENRGVPNPFIRSGLFSVKQVTQREYLKEVQIASLSNYEVMYQGEELQQDDLSVWMSLINLARAQPMSDQVLFTGYQLIKDLGWRMHSESYKRAKDSIARLKITGITIVNKDKTKGYTGSLIREFAWEHMDINGNAKWMVRFEPRISVLFMEDTTTLLEWETRKKIGTRASLALWLHSFYSSHRDPIPIAVAKLHELCRSGAPLSTFRRNLKLALERLREVGFLRDYAIISDVLSVQKIRQSKLAAVPTPAIT